MVIFDNSSSPSRRGEGNIPLREKFWRVKDGYASRERGLKIYFTGKDAWITAILKGKLRG